MKSANKKEVFNTIFFLLFITIFLFIFNGCQDKSSQQNKIIFWTSSLKPYFTSYIEEVIKNFEDLYNVGVEWQDYPLDTIYQKILTTYGSNLSPDVVNVNPLLAAGLYKQNITIEFDQSISKSYYSNLIEGCKINGKLITIPWYSSTKMLIYNKKIFDFSKVKIRDYKDFFLIAKEIKESKGIYGFYPFLKFEQDMLALGLIDNPYDPFNSKVLEFFEYLRNNKDYFPSGFWVSSVEIAYSMYKDRKVASIIIGPQFLYRIKKEDPELYSSTDVLLFPFRNYPVSVMSLSIINNKDQQRIGNAIKFVRFLTNFENQNKLFKLVPIVPSIPGKYNVKDNDKIIEKVKIQMVNIFPHSKVFDLYFYDVLPDPVKRSNIFKNFLNDVFNSNIPIYEIEKKYGSIWNKGK